MSAQPSVSIPSSAHAAGLSVGGKYTLVRPLGVGGMGAVWVARNEATGAEVAMKLLLETDVAEEARARFRREAYATALLSHRAIVKIYDLLDLPPIGGGEGLALVMELLHGRTLAAHLEERGRVSLDEALAIVLPLLSALSHAHAAGIIHRDLKPENVFLSVDPDGIVTPKILDFGISKLRLPKAPVITREGEMLGTPSYMSPEQVRGRGGVDGRSDLFNVGILLYELLSGKNPFAGDGLHSVVVAILEDEPAPLADVPEPVWRVVQRALRKSPEERFATAADLAAALRGAAGMACPPSLHPESSGEVRLSWAPSSNAPPAPGSRSKRWPLVLSAAASAAVAAVIAATLALWTTEVPPPAAPRETAPLATSSRIDRAPLATSPGDPGAAILSPQRATTIVAPLPDAAAAPATVPTVAPRPPARARARQGFVARDPGF